MGTQSDGKVNFTGEEVLKFHYRTLRVRDIEPIYRKRLDTAGVVHEDLTNLRIGDQSYAASDRFLRSMAVRFGFADSIFTLFTPAEVFGRIAERRSSDLIRLTTHDDTALSISSPNRGIVQADTLRDILRDLKTPPLAFRYSDGVVTTTHTAPDSDVQIRSEAWKNQFTLQTPVDGYGLPAAYLSMLRQVCTNGLVAFGSAFRSEFQLGKGSDTPKDAVVRQLNSFNSEDGFAAIAQRLTLAANTPPSLREIAVLEEAISTSVRMADKKSELDEVLAASSRVFGDISDMFQISTVEALPPARRAVLPMRGSMMDVINLATEVATYRTPLHRRPLDILVGKTLASSFDLEGLKPAGTDGPADFYLC